MYAKLFKFSELLADFDYHIFLSPTRNGMLDGCCLGRSGVAVEQALKECHNESIFLKLFLEFSCALWELRGPMTCP